MPETTLLWDETMETLDVGGFPAKIIKHPFFTVAAMYRRKEFHDCSVLIQNRHPEKPLNFNAYNFLLDASSFSRPAKAAAMGMFRGGKVVQIPLHGELIPPRMSEEALFYAVFSPFPEGPVIFHVEVRYLHGGLLFGKKKDDCYRLRFPFQGSSG